MNHMDIFYHWLENTSKDLELFEELCAIKNNGPAIKDRFYRDLEFGTGGLRGVLGAGTNRMNVYTVAKASQGYSNYLRGHYSEPSVALAYDSRINSELFARTAADVFAANDIHVWIYPKLMPTPALSFAVRDLQCSGGVVITASHNPSQYNGYKVYSGDGCQITTAVARAIQHEIDTVEPFRDAKRGDFDAQRKAGLITYIGEETVSRYLRAISGVSVLPKEADRDISIVYTPLNGSGISCVPRCLAENGFTSITIPNEQKDPDGNFPTCPYPNPEEPAALRVGLACAERTGSELLLATDPDCDRVGVAVRIGEGYRRINGNEMGVLLLDFICRMRKHNGTMPKDPVAVKTIVTTPMAYRVATHYGVQIIDVLTGFKFIGEQIGLLEKNGETGRFLFGFEESYGYLSGDFVRDKDAVNTSLLICEMAAYHKSYGKTLIDILEELSLQYGFYETELLSFVFEGAVGMVHMREIMENFRTHLPCEIAGQAVKKTVDYQKDETGLPRSNVIRFFLADGSETVIRPSGTEPKLKVYLTATGQTRQESIRNIQRLKTHFEDWFR